SSSALADHPVGTSRGEHISLYISPDEGMIVGYVGPDSLPIDAATGLPEGVRIVFVATVDEQGDGTYTFDLRDVLDHPVADAEDDVVLTFELELTDSNGFAQAHSFSVTVNDDGPVATGVVEVTAD